MCFQSRSEGILQDLDQNFSNGLMGWIRDCWFFVVGFGFLMQQRKQLKVVKSMFLQKLDVFWVDKNKLMEHFYAESSKCGSGFLHEISGLIGKSLV